MRSEAHQLAELVAAVCPTAPEAIGLLALLELTEARRAASFVVEDGEEVFVPLLEQDASRWDLSRIRRGHLLEAAISPAHCSRALTGLVPWREIVRLWRSCWCSGPTTASVLGLAVARVASAGPAAVPASLQLLDELPASARLAHQPWWTTRSHLLAVVGDLGADDGEATGAIGSLRRAIALTEHPRVRRFLERKLTALLASAQGR